MGWWWACSVLGGLNRRNTICSRRSRETFQKVPWSSNPVMSRWRYKHLIHSWMSYPGTRSVCILGQDWSWESWWPSVWWEGHLPKYRSYRWVILSEILPGGNHSLVIKSPMECKWCPYGFLFFFLFLSSGGNMCGDFEITSLEFSLFRDC